MFCCACGDFVEITEKNGRFYCERCKTQIRKEYLPVSDQRFVGSPEHYPPITGNEKLQGRCVVSYTPAKKVYITEPECGT